MQPTEKAKLLAERLTEFLLHNDTEDTPDKNSDSQMILAKLDEISRRLETVENELAARRNSEPSAENPLLLAHPSLQKFEIDEAIQFLPNTKIKACTFEPNGKPCDDCAMCSTRGF